jgi:hypothetical protein
VIAEASDRLATRCRAVVRAAFSRLRRDRFCPIPVVLGWAVTVNSYRMAPLVAKHPARGAPALARQLSCSAAYRARAQLSDAPERLSSCYGERCNGFVREARWRRGRRRRLLCRHSGSVGPAAACVARLGRNGSLGTGGARARDDPSFVDSAARRTTPKTPASSRPLAASVQAKRRGFGEERVDRDDPRGTCFPDDAQLSGRTWWGCSVRSGAVISRGRSEHVSDYAREERSAVGRVDLMLGRPIRASAGV